MIFAFPLLFAPAWTLGLFGIPVAASLPVRLVGAALIGIGGVFLFLILFGDITNLLYVDKARLHV